MPTRLSFRLPHSLRMGLLIAALAGILVGGLAWIQVHRERLGDLEEMDRRAHAIAHQMANPVRTALQLPDPEAEAALRHREVVQLLLNSNLHSTFLPSLNLAPRRSRWKMFAKLFKASATTPLRRRWRRRFRH